MPSIFSKLYRYRETKVRHQKENFLTEILAYCLVNDKEFRETFLKELGYTGVVSSFSCASQHYYEGFGKPDIYIRVNNTTAIIIECKVEAILESTQLNRYASLLAEKEKGESHLVLLTKYFEQTEVPKSKAHFKHMRWFQVHKMTLVSGNEVTKEFRNYLEDENMGSAETFTSEDKNAISRYISARSKMEEFLSHTVILPETCTRSLAKETRNFTKPYDQTNPPQIFA